MCCMIALALAQGLIRCQSVTPEEGGALTLLENVLRPAGFACHRLTMTEPGMPDVQNLYARLGTEAPHLCFAGHTDVVPVGEERAWTRPPFGGVVDGGILYGRGAADMKGGIACFVAAALDYLKANGGLKRGSLSFLITGDEEAIAINGTVKVLDWIKARGETLDACVVGECTSSAAVGDEIKIGRRGSVTAELIVEGKQGHAAYPQLADNPIPKLARMLDRLSSTPLDAGTPSFQPSNVQATVISVPNTASNVIPSLARAVINVRYNNLHSRPKIEAWIREHCESVGARDGRALRDEVLRQRRRVPDRAGAAGGDHERGGDRRDRAPGGPDHQRRHVGCALHLRPLPGDRGRPAQRHGAPGRRAGAGRRPRDADRIYRRFLERYFAG